MKPRDSIVRNERGAALVLALMVLLALAVLSAVLMVSLKAETRIAGLDVRTAEALNIAEAGVNEVVAHIRNGNIENSGANPRMVAQVFNAPAGSVPAVGADTTGIPTGQPGAATTWLQYTTATKGPNVLTAEYKTDPAKTTVFRYDRSLVPPIQTATGYPIYKITATGRVGRTSRKIVTEVMQKPIIARAMAAVTADVGIQFTGTADVCGYNHSLLTPTGTEGVHGTGGPCLGWETGSNNLAGAWSTADITGGGASQLDGQPVASTFQTGFYEGPWEALGMAQAEFWSWVGPPQSSIPGSLNGILYLDNNSVTQDQSASYGFHGGDGEGLLYIDGDAHFNAGFNYRGLIYVEGDLKINGHAWILGGLIVKGVADIKVANGNCEILYSKDAIEQNIAKHGGQFVTLSWKEMP
jgi:Tfp pilus assembly protein PilX